MNKIALRIDDIGASTKYFEQYSKLRIGNIGPLKNRRLLGAWGPYEEMTADSWRSTLAVLRKKKVNLTVAITGCWVERSGELVPFPLKFPDAAAVIKEGVAEGLLDLAVHGLTHCVLENGAFLPKFWRGNRSEHREFWDWLPGQIHDEHLRRATEILNTYFGNDIDILVPPGNVYSASTVSAAGKYGIRLLNCWDPKIQDPSGKVKILSGDRVVAFHDRELVLWGMDWLEKTIDAAKAKAEIVTLRQLGGI